MENKCWILKSRPKAGLSVDHFEWLQRPIQRPGPDQVLVKQLYLSLDPANRIWMAGPSYMPAVEIGEVMRGIGIGIVEESRSTAFKTGDIVSGLLGWQEYALMAASDLSRIQPITGLPLTTYLGPLGHIGLTAYFGLLDVGKPQPGETLVVTAAAGAVGSLAAQIGKIKGCRVVGIAGGEGKCRWLTDDLRLDAAIDYKAVDVLDALREACPAGIDIDFENVGGAILDGILTSINNGARIVLCGLISQYNSPGPQPGPFHFGNILIRRARVQGFIVTDYLDRADEAIQSLAKWLQEGNLQHRMELVHGLENAPQALASLFEGKNRGKLVLAVASE